MKRGLALLLLSFTAIPAMAGDDDWRWRNDRNADRRDRNRVRDYGYRSGNGYGSSSNIVRRAIENLRMAASRNRVDGHERNHFQRAIHHLQQFDYSYSHGRYDGGKLNDALDHMSDLARAHQVHPRDRQMLARDVSALRSLRPGRW